MYVCVFKGFPHIFGCYIISLLYGVIFSPLKIYKIRELINGGGDDELPIRYIIRRILYSIFHLENVFRVCRFCACFCHPNRHSPGDRREIQNPYMYSDHLRKLNYILLKPYDIRRIYRSNGFWVLSRYWFLTI